MSRLLAFCLVALPVAAQLRTEALRIGSPTPRAGGAFGIAVASAGDVTGDGVVDLVVGAFGEARQAYGTGRAHVYDGVTGQLVRTLAPTRDDQGSAFGATVASLGDADGDGIDDLAVGAPGVAGGRVFVFSGATGAWHGTLSDVRGSGAFGHALARTSDADGDGTDDLVVGDCKRSDRGTETGGATVMSGRTGQILARLAPPTPERGLDFGRAVAGGADVTGVGDWAVAARNEDAADRYGTVPDAGRVHLFDGRTDALVRSVEAPRPSPGGQFGLSLALCPGPRPLLVVGAGREGERQQGAAYVFDAATGERLHTLAPTSQAPRVRFGQSVACAGDVDGGGDGRRARRRAGPLHRPRPGRRRRRDASARGAVAR